jgi:hypothetical protein
LQNAVEGVEGQNDPGWESPVLGGMIGGAIKSAASGLGGILDMINGPREGFSQFDPKTFVDAYKNVHPEATPAQISAIANKTVSNPNKAPSPTIQAVSNWLHSSGQPTGFWESVGAVGEQMLELVGGEGFLKLASAPAKAVEAGKAIETFDTAAHVAQAGQLSKILKTNPKVAGLVAIGLKASADALKIGTQSYIHTEDPKTAIEAGATAGVLGGGAHLVSDAVGGLANAGEKLAPSTINVAGVDIPVAATHPQLPEGEGVGDHFIKGSATKEGAKNFVATKVQPAAVKATQSNFTQSALDAVDDLHGAQGTPSFAETGQQPQLGTVDDIAKYMKQEAKTTYQKLDDAAQPEIQAWEDQYGKAASKQQPSTLLDANGKPIVTPGEAIPDKPKLFTQLQDQISGAKSTIGSKLSSQVDKENAITNLPKYEQEMKDFTTKHSDVVNPDELKAANSVYSKGLKYDYIADKMRAATKGAEAGNTFKGDIASLHPRALETLPRQFDTQYGEGSFADLLGGKGVKNYNDIVNALKMPTTGSTFLEWLKQLPLNAGKIATIPAGNLADRILFDPEAGARLLNKFRAYESTVNQVSKGGEVAASQTIANSHAASNTAKQANRQALNGTQSSLGGSDNGSPKTNPLGTYDTGPLAGKSVDGMVQQGNIDVNHRPSITNADGSHSGIFSMTVPVDSTGHSVDWGSSKIANYALVPSIANGKFLTPDGKMPQGKESIGKLEDEATKYYDKTHEHLGIFKTEDAANKYATATHAYVNDGTDKKVYTPSY